MGPQSAPALGQSAASGYIPFASDKLFSVTAFWIAQLRISRGRSPRTQLAAPVARAPRRERGARTRARAGARALPLTAQLVASRAARFRCIPSTSGAAYRPVHITHSRPPKLHMKGVWHACDANQLLARVPCMHVSSQRSLSTRCISWAHLPIAHVVHLSPFRAGDEKCISIRNHQCPLPFLWTPTTCRYTRERWLPWLLYRWRT